MFFSGFKMVLSGLFYELLRVGHFGPYEEVAFWDSFDDFFGANPRFS